MITGSQLLEALPVIASLIVIEGLLSVDNALGIAAMAANLPERNRLLALRLGIIGAYVGRGLALASAAWIIQSPWVKGIGAAYLIYLMCAHLTEKHGQDGAGQPRKVSLFLTIVQIEFMDLSLSIDNVVAAVALSPKLWVVCAGVFIGILVLRFLAGFCIGLLERLPILAKTAFLLVGFVGVILAFELATGSEVGALLKFGGISLITALTIIYAKNERAHRLLRPMVSIARLPMKAVASVGQWLTWPVRIAVQRIGGIAARLIARRRRRRSS